MKKLTVFILSCYLYLVISPVVWAANLYVNNSGSPTCSNATVKSSNNASNPWCDVIRAVRGSTTHASPSASEAATAGDTVYITAGTYNTSSGPASSPLTGVILNAVNDGTLGSPITFQAVGTVTLTHNVAANPLIGSNGRDYIWWRGAFYINEANAATTADTGAVVFFQATGGGVDGIEVNGNGGTVPDNHTGVRLQSSDGVTVKNARIHNITNTVVSSINASCVQFYDAYGVVVEHNELYDCGTGIFVKEQDSGSLTGTVFLRFNYIHDVTRGGIMLNNIISTTPAYHIYQNIIKTGASADGGFLFWQVPPNGRAFRADVVNNTFYGNNNGCFHFGAADPVAGDANRVYNNICASSDAGIYSDVSTVSDLSATTAVAFEHNVYYSNTNVARLSGTTYTLATWKSGSGQDGVAPAAGSSDPLFVNGGGSFLLATDFKLQGSSPYLTQGVDILDLDGDSSTSDNIPAGAYITGNEQIGIESTVGSVTVSGAVGFSGTVRIQ